MPTSALPGLAAVLLAAAATPALAQGYGQPGGYAQGSGSNAGYGSQAYPPSTYDRRSPSGDTRQAPSDRDRRPGDYGGAERYGQPDRYDQGQRPDQGGAEAEDPEQLARRLNLTGAQRGAYDSYRRAFQPDEARARQEEDDMRRMASLTTPQRLDAARAAQARDRADFDRTDAATRAFYAQLSPAQRRTFDQLTAPQMDEDGPDQGGGPSPTQPAARPPR